MPTLLDVATAAGVSKSTASRALSSPDLVAPATVERVLAAVSELGFVPNRAARGLARGRTGIVALVVPTLANSFFTPIIGGAQDRAAEDDLQLTVAVNALESSEEVRRFERLAREVDGLLVVAPRGPDATVAHVAGLNPTVLIDRELAGVSSVVANTAVAFAHLIESLAGLGHRHVLYLGGPDRSWQNSQREDAVVAAGRRCDVALDVLGPFPPTFDAGSGVVEDVIGSGASVVLPYATDIGLGLLLALQRRGKASWRVEPTAPGSLAVAGIPGTAMVDVDGVALGRRATDRLVRRMASPAEPVTSDRLSVPIAWPRY